jgi:hypothetical protein
MISSGIQTKIGWMTFGQQSYDLNLQEEREL